MFNFHLRKIFGCPTLGETLVKMFNSARVCVLDNLEYTFFISSNKLLFILFFTPYQTVKVSHAFQPYKTLNVIIFNC